ncbi:MAG: glycosyltransferase, partial [Bacillota bacterium]
NLVQSMDGSPLDLDRINSLSRIVYESTDLLLYVLEWYDSTKNRNQQLAIAHVLSHRIDYLMLKIDTEGYEHIIDILEDMLNLHIIEDFIDFVNVNKNLPIENKLVPLIRSCVAKDKYLLEEFSIYLKEDKLKKIGIPKLKQPVIPRDPSPLERSKIIWISSWIAFAILVFPLIFFITRFKIIFSGTVNVFEYLIISINNYLVIYFLAANLVYLILLLISVKGSKERLDLWKIKNQTLLFEHDVLPSISIVAPAYNEEISIIESVTSLLNLKYPVYEVIVVNDGSKDDTINVLIKHFNLERKHPFFKLKLKTKALRGVYINKNIPNLIVIDKQNGGKADALNLGINVAKNNYICGIDADSLLEEDALLKLMSITLDHTVDHIALGGNIVPVNGCIVDKGKIEHSGLGKNQLVRFQTLEYLRAFTTGRIGWSTIHSLLIISGAFGLFQRKALLETGGYLTISGDLKKDTVGEDMELVVRLTYEALKKKNPYRVEYVHHANCFTELPNDLRSLMKQRNRWQRGLLDILSYHRKLLFNPRYKQPGMISFPYFFIFEMVGPFLEIIGYIALVIGLSFGLLNTPFVIVLFVATIGFGMVISLFSLWIAEKKNVFYSNKETGILVLTAILENFGYRQLMSLQRVFSTFSALKESGSWGSQKRQGFIKNNIEV